MVGDLAPNPLIDLSDAYEKHFFSEHRNPWNSIR
jgi:hypothetical protein